MNIIEEKPTEHKLKKEPSVAVLFHLADWKSIRSEVEIADNIVMANFSGSQVSQLYNHLCVEHGVDDGESFMYGSYARIDPFESGENLLDEGFAPYDLIDRLCNAVVILNGNPITSTRVIASEDDFHSSLQTWGINYIRIQTELLGYKSPTFSDKFFADLKTGWQTMESLWQQDKRMGRLNNALLHFFYTWRSAYIEQACLQLGVCLGGLFSPSEGSDTRHLQCNNIFQFFGSTEEERIDIYGLFRRFFALHSALVHGGVPEQDKLIEITAGAFRHTCAILRRIISNPATVKIFASEDKRLKLCDDFI